jgi:hypothetical protein
MQRQCSFEEAAGRVSINTNTNTLTSSSVWPPALESLALASELAQNSTSNNNNSNNNNNNNNNDNNNNNNNNIGSAGQGDATAPSSAHFDIIISSGGGVSESELGPEERQAANTLQRMTTPDLAGYESARRVVSGGGELRRMGSVYSVGALEDAGAALSRGDSMEVWTMYAPLPLDGRKVKRRDDTRPPLSSYSYNSSNSNFNNNNSNNNSNNNNSNSKRVKADETVELVEADAAVVLERLHSQQQVHVCVCCNNML